MPAITSAVTPEVAPQAAVAPLDVQGWKWAADDGDFPCIIGTVRNTRQSAIDYVEVKFAIYDKSQNQIGTAMTNMTDFGAGQSWKFKACALEDGVASARLLGVTTIP